MPSISFIIPTRDRRDQLARAIESLLAQHDGRWEALVVDDGSRDGTGGYLQAVAREDGRIHPLRTSIAGGRGACFARNLGLSQATGRYVVFLDDDDLMEPYAVGERIAFMEANEAIDFAVSQGRCFHDRPDDLEVLWNVDGPDDPEVDIDRFLRRDIPWQTTGPTWRREALARVGPWDERAPSAHDLDFHVRALVAGLRYRRTSGWDFQWRQGRAGRASIGTASVQASHWAYRAVLQERFFHLLRRTGRLNERRRLLLAGGFWLAAEQVRRRAGVREATRIWDRCRLLGLIGLRRWLEGLAFLTGYGQRQSREPARWWISRTWPPELRLAPSPTHTRAPIPPQWLVAALAKRPAPPVPAPASASGPRG